MKKHEANKPRTNMKPSKLTRAGQPHLIDELPLTSLSETVSDIMHPWIPVHQKFIAASSSAAEAVVV